MCICITDIDFVKYVENYSFLSCWKEVVCIEYALFVEYAIFVKSLIICCFGCHGNMNRDNSFVNFNLMLKIRCWLRNMCLNNQFDPLFRGDVLL